MKNLAECYHLVANLDYIGRREDNEGTVKEYYYCPLCKDELYHISYDLTNGRNLG